MDLDRSPKDNDSGASPSTASSIAIIRFFFTSNIVAVTKLLADTWEKVAV